MWMLVAILVTGEQAAYIEHSTAKPVVFRTEQVCQLQALQLKHNGYAKAMNVSRFMCVPDGMKYDA